MSEIHQTIACSTFDPRSIIPLKYIFNTIVWENFAVKIFIGHVILRKLNTQNISPIE